MRNIKLTIEYDGSHYHGFQRQDGQNLPTIQETLENALSKLTGKKIQVTASGRTDAGVHALGQVVNFYTDCTIPAANLPRAVNSLLPVEIVAKEAREVPEDFHAQFRAHKKTYRYSIHNNPVPSVFYRKYAYFVPRKLDVKAMQQAAGYLLGEHDFSSFRAAGSSARSSVRTMYQAKVVQEGDLLNIYLEANGFLYNMVRIIVGTLIYVGNGKLQAKDMELILNSCDRTLAGPTVPPHGLFLMSVEY